MKVELKAKKEELIALIEDEVRKEALQGLTEEDFNHLKRIVAMSLLVELEEFVSEYVDSALETIYICKGGDKTCDISIF